MKYIKSLKFNCWFDFSFVNEGNSFEVFVQGFDVSVVLKNGIKLDEIHGDVQDTDYPLVVHIDNGLLEDREEIEQEIKEVINEQISNKIGDHIIRKLSNRFKCTVK